MYPLRQALLDHDLIVLRILGEWYDLDLIGHDKEQSADALSAALQETNFEEEMRFLQPAEAEAMLALVAAGGKIPVATFMREFGEVRQMGPGKLEREEPWLMPESPAEALWYRGFLFRGFDETDDGLIEYYFVPPELMERIELPPEPEEKQAVKPASQPKAKVDNSAEAANLSSALADVEKFIAQTKARKGLSQSAETEIAAEPPAKEAPAPAQAEKPPVAPARSEKKEFSAEKSPPPQAVKPQRPLLSSSDAVDDLTTMLALSQRQTVLVEEMSALARYLRNGDADRLSLLLQIGLDGQLLRRTDAGALKPARGAVDWLKLGREQQLRQLIVIWRECGWNALRRVPGLICEGDWQNDPKRPRAALLDHLPRNQAWIALADLIQTIKDDNPDFQRPDGDYAAWYIRDQQSKAFLTGFESWDFVEGNVLEYVAFRPMFWLGLTDVSGDDEQPALRLTARALDWLANRPATDKATNPPLVLKADSTLHVPAAASRFERFQATRIAEPQPLQNKQPYLFRITPASLAAAKSQGITPDKVLQFLQKATGQPLPTAPKRAIERWQQNGTEGRLDSLIVLRVGDPSVIATLRENPKTRDLLGESLGELAVAIEPKNAAALRQAVAQLGLLLDFD